ncbi:GntR family transcriptional regulator [Phytohabitans sp. ZYX-F-186]|uniref:GntR family transcriptional regulator n=1 Tax=Phytohabitans maris TaxID=3071409 RepID=A0ABU0ZW48_9ACTN|nr:GntR family transcriptional regulator [Phytohabitans sp. ZYX-F-186]MDQ7911155.1 GntR family transcriptional regulator [Phytohabitans sp. ZYX-F-186]
MAHDVDDKRTLFVRVVDDIVDQIRTRRLQGGEVLPTARKMAESYGVASMTAQRALRELQQRGLTYAVVGKGTFVHPLAAERLDAEARGAPISGARLLILDDPDLNRRVAQFLLHQNEIAGRIVDAMMAKDVPAMNAATAELAALKAANRDLATAIAKYEADTSVEPPAAEAPDPPAPTPRRKRKTNP